MKSGKKAQIGSFLTSNLGKIILFLVAVAIALVIIFWGIPALGGQIQYLENLW